jgi:hypothetical protein
VRKFKPASKDWTKRLQAAFALLVSADDELYSSEVFTLGYSQGDPYAVSEADALLDFSERAHRLFNYLLSDFLVDEKV